MQLCQRKLALLDADVFLHVVAGSVSQNLKLNLFSRQLLRSHHLMNCTMYAGLELLHFWVSFLPEESLCTGGCKCDFTHLYWSVKLIV